MKKFCNYIMKKHLVNAARLKPSWNTIFTDFLFQWMSSYNSQADLSVKAWELILALLLLKASVLDDIIFLCKWDTCLIFTWKVWERLGNIAKSFMSRENVLFILNWSENLVLVSSLNKFTTSEVWEFYE